MIRFYIYYMYKLIYFNKLKSMLQGELKGIRVLEFKNVHTNWVKQVAYYGTLRSFISSSRCSICSLLISDLTKAKTQYRFKVNMGISCFTFCEGIFSYKKKFLFIYLYIYF